MSLREVKKNLWLLYVWNRATLELICDRAGFAPCQDDTDAELRMVILSRLNKTPA